MNISTAQVLLPLLIMGLGIIVLMLQIAIKRNASITVALSALVLGCTAWAAVKGITAGSVEATALLIVDGYGQLMTVVITLAALVTLLVSHRWLAVEQLERGEYAMLLLLASFGAVVLVHAQHFAAFLLGLEILGVSVYSLVAYPGKSPAPIEAGLKYLVLSSASTAILLFGFALLYAASGSLAFEGMAGRLAASSGVLVAGASLMIFTGLGFKLSLVPFHMWTPDVYEGAPTPVTGFLATVSKVAIFAALLRWYESANLGAIAPLTQVLGCLAIASMLVGNLLALKQNNVKRLLGYSSIAHMGYLLIALVVLGGVVPTGMASEAALWYLIAYTASTLAAFTALSALASRGWAAEACNLDDLRGLFWREPLLALGLSVSLLSLAGVPLTAGFMGKFYLVATGVEAGAWTLLMALVVGSAISTFYYLRIIYTLSSGAAEALARVNGDRSLSDALMIALLAAVLLLGIYPEPIMGVLASVL